MCNKVCIKGINNNSPPFLNFRCPFSSRLSSFLLFFLHTWILHFLLYMVGQVIWARLPATAFSGFFLPGCVPWSFPTLSWNTLSVYALQVISILYPIPLLVLTPLRSCSVPSGMAREDCDIDTVSYSSGRLFILDGVHFNLVLQPRRFRSIWRRVQEWVKICGYQWQCIWIRQV